MLDNIFIHIGYPKTGSTWLQSYIFPKHSKMEYPILDIGCLWQIMYSHDFDFDAQYFRSTFKSNKKELEKPSLLSQESFVGNAFTGGKNSCQNANRLYAIFPNAKIIICIRNQLDIITSFYKQYIHIGGTCSFKNFLSLRFPFSFVYFSLDYLQYDRIIKYYQELFGIDAVYVGLYEELKESPQRFLNSLFSFINLPPLIPDETTVRMRPNLGMSAFSLAIMRFGNHFLSGVVNPGSVFGRFGKSPSLRKFLQGYADPLVFNKIPCRKTYISTKMKSYLWNYFKASNHMLVDRLGVPLERYGYPL